ncbi:Zinc finger protein CONSTANS-LIKE 4 [Zea mays]|uniref:Zinc finger protein CONSTANS-LIKE 4 n=1 Tax=Zea mays TaxID=4577 RepID=A0A3L6EWF4_MAIZE|nr:Zinc finger protein CONSTANS-LIKE 4 [Zea mays]
MLDGDDGHPLISDDISSPIAAHILDFYDDDDGGCGGSGGDLFVTVNAASDMFTVSSEDGSTSSVTTPPAPCGGHGDNVSSLDAAAAAAASAFSPMPFLDSTLSALLEVEEDAPVLDTELLAIDDYRFAATAVAGDEPRPEQQRFAQVPMVLPVAEHPSSLQTQMSSTAFELLHAASSSSGYTDNDCFATAMDEGGGYVGLDEALCQQQQLSAGMMETAAQGCYFVNGPTAQGVLFGASGSGMVMPMTAGLEEIGEYQRMMESASAALAATHSPDADPVAAAQQMAFSGNGGEMQMGGGSMSPGRLPAATEAASSLEDTDFKSARITVEERREKIHRYIKKRNERNFSKKIKYACRKTLADSRPRVRGRFAKNDDYGEPSSRVAHNHDEYDHMAAMKAQDILDPDALQAAMNSYMYNHTVESWM